MSRPVTSVSAIDTTPRVRGLRLGDLGIIAECRYNPACAGTTKPKRPLSASTTIQPRVCGDYPVVSFVAHMRADTTPRVRGLRDALVGIFRQRRYNPACAGTTLALMARTAWMEIQPRVCGDYQLAGSLQVVLLHELTIQPRVCGDYFTAPPPSPAKIDTTPRVRGLLLFCDCHVLSLRYNPACAGTTCPPPRRVSSRAIQPRVCGDYAQGRLDRAEDGDTTPRVRGLLERFLRRDVVFRYNPACAGTTHSYLYR